MLSPRHDPLSHGTSVTLVKVEVTYAQNPVVLEAGSWTAQLFSLVVRHVSSLEDLSHR